MEKDLSALREALEKAGQGHVLRFVDDGKCSEAETRALLDQLAAMDVGEAVAIYESTVAGGGAAAAEEEPCEPLPADRVAHLEDCDAADVEAWRSEGLSAIARGAVAACVLAGGQGTRLGFDGPKGFYDVGLPSGKSLFQLMAERVARLRVMAADAHHDGDVSRVSLPFLVMTSPLNDGATRAFFARHAHFGLPADDVFFFAQGTLPCMTEDGAFILESKCRVATAPDGNGGIYPALRDSGALGELSRRGVQALHVFSVDNALVKPADPVFVGFCRSRGADCGNVVCWKRDAGEKVGVVALRGGRPCVVEYSEISDEDRLRTDGEGKLAFGAGNICNHYFTLDFIQREVLGNQRNLYHIARKKIPAAGEDGAARRPEANNGIKLETFIFDCFPQSRAMAILGVPRAEYFAPVKNKPGSPSDTPEAARRALSDMFRAWAARAGARVSGAEDAVCEIDPALSYAGENLGAALREAGGEVAAPFWLRAPADGGGWYCALQ